jgi:murein DD-endopeptidase MepM/ murein hydrolase activator NlpD
MPAHRRAETIKKIAFILIQKQDPDSKFPFSPYRLRKFENRAKYRRFFSFPTLRSGGVFFGVSAFFIAILFPLSVAHAGILAFVGEILNDLHFSKEFLGITTNSQTMPLLEAVRNFDPSPDPDGSDITIVDNSAILAHAAPDHSGDALSNTSSASDQISVYVVRKGDTLSAIAKMFGVSVNTILWANDIPKGGSVKVDQKLVILPVSGVQHTIKKGDTVAKLAILYKADTDDIYSANDIAEDEKLAVGDTIIIPNGIESEIPAVAPKKGTRGYVPPGNSSFIATDGYFVRPTAGRKTQGIHGHNGIDFHAAKGTVVAAAAAGTVVVSRNDGWNGGYGQYIVIKHSNGTQTLYAHLSNNIVFEGQEVYQGQPIAYSGATGKSFGPHLHFEVRGGRNPF